MARAAYSPPVDLGLGLATTAAMARAPRPRRRSRSAGVVGAALFATSLQALITTPERWGWNVSATPDVSVDESERDALLEVLAADPDVADVAISQLAAVVVEDEQVAGLALDSPARRPAATLLSGRDPLAGEVVLGERTLDRVDRESATSSRPKTATARCTNFE